MVTHAYRRFNGLKFGLIYTYISSFIEIGQKMTKLSSEKAIFSTKISQAWPMVTYAYRHSNGLKFGLISTHISSFIEIGRKVTKLSSEKAVFLPKSIKREGWSTMRNGVKGHWSLSEYLPTFQVSSRLVKKWWSYDPQTPNIEDR